MTMVEDRKMPVSAPPQDERFAHSRVLDAMPDAVVIVAADGKIVNLNVAAEAMFGYTRDALLGQSIEVLLPERLRESHVAHRDEYYAKPYARPMGVGMDLFAVQKDGREFPVEISLAPFLAPEGPQVVASIRDMSERHRAREQAQ
jgi:PAS domain S-box-containing protein